MRCSISLARRGYSLDLGLDMSVHLPKCQCWITCIQYIPFHTQIAKFIGPTWGPPGSCRPQMGPMLVPWTLLSGYARGFTLSRFFCHIISCSGFTWCIIHILWGCFSTNPSNNEATRNDMGKTEWYLIAVNHSKTGTMCVCIGMWLYVSRMTQIHVHIFQPPDQLIALFIWHRYVTNPLDTNSNKHSVVRVWIK